MNFVLTLYRLALSTIGALLLVAGVVLFPGWLDRLSWIAAITAVTAFLRRDQLAVTKYAAIHLIAPLAVGGALIIGVVPTALGLAIGIFAADRTWLRRNTSAAWQTAAREVTALFAAFGWYALARGPLGADNSVLDGQSVPAVAVFVLVHLIFSKALY